MPLSQTLLVLAIYVLVAARVTRLVNYDSLLDPIRLWIARHASIAQEQITEFTTPEQNLRAARRYARWTTLFDFIACPFCIGFWASVALAPIPIEVIGWPLWTWAVLPWAASHLIGIGDRWVSEDVEIEGGA